jgi:DNA-directed RNA polymerase subunit L
LLKEVLAKQDAIEAAKQQANDEAEEKGNLTKRKQEEREEMKAAKKAARKFCAATIAMAMGETGRSIQPSRPL